MKTPGQLLVLVIATYWQLVPGQVGETTYRSLSDGYALSSDVAWIEMIDSTVSRSYMFCLHSCNQNASCLAAQYTTFTSANDVNCKLFNDTITTGFTSAESKTKIYNKQGEIASYFNLYLTDTKRGIIFL